MRIAIVSHNVVRGDGQGRVNYEIVRHALSRGHRVSLLADRVDPCLLEDGAEWIPIRPGHQRVDLLKIARSVPLANAALDRMAERADIDVVHGNGYVLSRPHHVNTSHFVHAAWRAARRQCVERRRGVQTAYQALSAALNTRWERVAYARAKVVVAISERVRGELIGIGVAPERVRVIYNGVDTCEFRPGAVERQQVGLPASVPLALFVGDIRSPRKNLESLLKAIARLPWLHAAVVGNTAGSPYPEVAAELGVAERTHFLGFRRDVADLMRASDVLVSPARYEPFSLVVLEAMASGLPVVISEALGVAEIVDGATGIKLADPDDSGALADALQGLFDDAARRAAMGEAARVVAERHSWAHMVDAYVRVYESVAAA